MGSEWAAAARLVRRTGFGGTGDTVDAAVKEGTAKYAARILDADPSADAGAKRTPAPTFDPPPSPGNRDPGSDERKQYRHELAGQGQQLVAWWLRRMLAVEQPFGEKSTFVWHGHFATSLKKVRTAPLMLAQNEKLRAGGRGDFDDLAYAVLVDGATLRWLDGQKNTVKGPNENLSREFMEIFALGHGDGYTEDDVRSGSRALTGLGFDRRTGETVLRPRLHDNGSKTLFGRTANFDPKSFCAAVLARPDHPKYVATRMYNAYVSNSAPPAAVLDRLTRAYGSDHDLRAMFTTMFSDPSFAAAEGDYIIGPVEWLIGALRVLDVPVDDDLLQRTGGALRSLGQLPMFPPSVGGWPSGMVWMSTAAADLRFRTATLLAKQAEVPADVSSGSTTSRLEKLAHLLAVERWSDETLAVLKGSASDPHTLLAVALNTPEYLVH